jgi:hypothetical protein
MAILSENVTDFLGRLALHFFLFGGAYSDNELDDDDSNTTDSPVEILPGQNCCCLCNKHGCDQGSQFCAKCQLYMSRFQPSEC